jgi:PKD repeat protein
MLKRIFTLVCLLCGLYANAQYLNTTNTTCELTPNGNTSTLCLNWQDYVSAGPDLDSIVFTGVVGNTVKVDAYTHDYGSCIWLAVMVNMNTTKSITLPANYATYNIEVTEKMASNLPCGAGSFTPFTPFIENSNNVVCSATSACTASFTYTTNPNNTYNFVSTSIAPSANLYYWTFGNGTGAIGPNASINFGASGTYNVCLIILDSNQAVCDSVCQSIVVTNPSTICNASFTASPAPNALNTIDFVSTSTGGSSVPLLFWDYGDGNSGFGSSLSSHTYASPGNYTVCLYQYDTIIQGPQTSPGVYCTAQASGAIDGDIFGVTIGNMTNLTNNCSATNVGTAGIAVSAINQMYADFSNILMGTFTQNEVVPFSINLDFCQNPGFGRHTKIWIDYNRNGTFTDPGEEVYTTTSAQLGSYVVSGTFTIPSSFIPGLTRLRIRNEETMMAGMMSPCGSSGIGEVEDYSVNLVLVSAAPCDSICQLVSVGSAVPCVASFTYTANPNNTYSFTSTSQAPAGYTYYWTFGNGTGAIGPNASNNFGASGTYNVCLIILDANQAVCDSFCQAIVVSTPTTTCNATMTYSSNVCDGIFVNTSAAGYSNALWIWGDGTTTVDNNPTVIHTYSASGVYYPMLVITYTNSNGTVCIDSSALGQLPINCSTSTCLASFTSANGANGTVTFTNTSTPLSPSSTAIWSFGDGTSANTLNPVHTYTANGIYTVCLTITTSLPNGTACTATVCATTTITNVSTTAPCNAAFTHTMSSTNSFNFVSTSTPSAANAIYQWSFGDGNFSTMSNPTHTYTASGVYTVCLIYSVGNSPATFCSDTVCQVVTAQVNQIPCTASFTYTSNPNNTYSFTSTSQAPAGYTYLWSFGNGNTGLGTTVTHNYATNGTYNVCLVILDSLNNMCDSACQTIVVGNVPVTCAADYSFVTNGTSVVFTNNTTVSNGAAYTSAWYFGDGFTSTAANPSHTYTSQGTYTVCLVIISANNCIDSICKVVTVTAPGGCQASFNSSVNQCSATFTNTSTGNATNGYWYFGSGAPIQLTGANQTVTQNFNANGVYNACLVIFTPGTTCSDTSCVPVVIFNCPTSIDDAGWAKEVSLAPNPTKGLIQLNLSVQKSMDTRVQVLDALGRVLISDNYQLSFGKNSITLNTMDFPKGTYLVRISGAQEGNAILRFIKE